ncbi:putative NRPS-like protein biosynthetic cluster [Marasmius tenuissimus]|nr:putative NRPS-like protein biosynthetic cluster [Marasmius tenuissimus]
MSIPFTAIQGGSTPTFHPPPPDNLTLVELFDYHGLNNQDHSLFRYEDDDGHIHDIPWKSALPAIHTVARKVQQFVAPQATTSVPVVAILAVADSIAYYTAIAGIMRAGYVAFPISVRNSGKAVAHLVKATNAHHILISQDPGMRNLFSAALELLDGHEIAEAPMPSFDEIYVQTSKGDPPPSPQVNQDALAMVMHSSGSTAFPKPIPFTYRTLKESGLLPYYGEVDICGNFLSAHAVPMFHLMGAVQIAWTVYTGVVMTVFRPGWPPLIPTPDKVFSAAKATSCNIMFCVPVFLENWSKDPEKIAVLRTYKTIIFAGGPLQPTVGKMLVSEGINIVPLYGQTETATVTLFLPKAPPPEGFEYWRFSPHCSPIFIPYDEKEGVFRLVFKETPSHQPAILNTAVDGIPALDTNDLITRHPTNHELWKVYGRGDDQIMHSSGEKTNPVPLEEIVNKDPKVANSIMFGRGRFHAGIIVAPTPEQGFSPGALDMVAAFRNEIWPSIEKANEYAPQHSRIFKEMIVVADPAKPFEFTPKGTPRRQAVLDAYAGEIEAAYNSVKTSSQTQLIPPLEWDQGSALEFVKKAIGKVLKTKVPDDGDIFQHGCDSLQATWIRNTILHALQTSSPINTREIPQSFVYQNPSIKSLAEFLVKATKGSHERNSEENTVAMHKLVGEVSSGLFKTTAEPLASGPHVVLLTGSTGAFGSYILASLLRSATVSKVYAVVRKNKIDAASRQRGAFASRGLEASLADSSKLHLLEGDLNADNLGLEPDVYHGLQQAVTSIIHNAWTVDFNVTLSTLEPLVRGTRKLIDLALSSKTLPSFIFVSSVGVIRNTPIGEESFITDAKVAAGWGYAESKWCAESLLQKVGEETLLKPIIVRCGQLSGARGQPEYGGFWNMDEWFPTLVKCSSRIGQLPDVPGNASWIPIDAAAQVVADFAMLHPGANAEVVNLAHSRPVPVTEIISHLKDALNLKTVPYDQWFTALEASIEDGTNTSEADRHVVARLLEFFRSMQIGITKSGSEAFGFPTIITGKRERLLNSSETEVPLDEKDVVAWVRNWRL